MAHSYIIRNAVSADFETLVAFTLREAREAEGIELDVEAARRGVGGAFEEPRQATYWVVEERDGRVVASASVVTEWSNFHGGRYWWVQSLYIVPEHRGDGLVELILDHLAHSARGGRPGPAPLCTRIQRTRDEGVSPLRLHCGAVCHHDAAFDLIHGSGVG